MLRTMFVQEGNTIRNMVREGEIVFAPSLGGRITREKDKLFLITSTKKIEIPRDLIHKIKIRKENNRKIAYSE